MNTVDFESVSEKDLLSLLFSSLSLRTSPQEVALLIDKLGASSWLPDQNNQDALKRLASYAGLVSSMPSSFSKHPGLFKAFTSAENAIMPLAAAKKVTLPPADFKDAVSLKIWVAVALQVLGLNSASFSPPVATKSSRVNAYGYFSKPKGARGQKHGHVDRRAALPASARRAELPGVSTRQYRHAVKTVLHLQQRAGVLFKVQQYEAAVAFAKSRLASSIKEEDFVSNVKAAAFVAYYTARLNMRTVFTASSQALPMDDLAEGLLQAALKDPGLDASVIAKVLTRQSVLSLLSSQQKGELLGVYYQKMLSFAEYLEALFDPLRDRSSMVVRKGDDSSSWNAASRAFNQARTGYLNLVTALGLTELLDVSIPGKVPALIAADVAFWHESSGSALHNDLLVWAALPLPWDVLLHDVVCTRDLVSTVCLAYGLDSDISGWTSAFKQGSLAISIPAPELVHGVVVSSAALAKVFKQMGCFSAQST